MLAQLDQCEVIVVATELVLDRLPMQGLVVHFEVIVFYITPLLIYVFLIKVVVARRNKRRLYFFVVQFLPGKVTEPGMFLDLSGAFCGPKPVVRLALDHLNSYSNCALTLLMKSAASTDQPFGMS